MVRKERFQEPFSRRDIASLDRGVQAKSEPPEGWVTLLGICRIFYPDRAETRSKSLKKIVSPLTKMHPEWMGRFAGNGPKGLRVHYSPAMVDAVAEALGNPNRADRDNNTGISYYQRRIEKNKQRKETLAYLLGEQSIRDAEFDYSKVLERVKDKRGGIHWKDMEGNPALLATVLKNEVRTFLTEGLDVSSRVEIVRRYYPGGWKQLKIDLNLGENTSFSFQDADEELGRLIK